MILKQEMFRRQKKKEEFKFGRYINYQYNTLKRNINDVLKATPNIIAKGRNVS
jgi:hypothetical protein